MSTDQPSLLSCQETAELTQIEAEIETKSQQLARLHERQATLIVKQITAMVLKICPTGTSMELGVDYFNNGYFFDGIPHVITKADGLIDWPGEKLDAHLMANLSNALGPVGPLGTCEGIRINLETGLLVQHK